MADVGRRLSDNAAGDFFVDATCIDCGTCRRVAPDSFAEGLGGSRVHRQPDSPGQVGRARMALVACPVAAIGTGAKHDLQEARRAFPEPIEEDVYFCGWASPRSYGAASYFIRRPGGNVLVDSPRFARPLVERLEALGGVALMVLSHIDDVADHEAFARHFGCDRVIHRADAQGALAVAERLIDGDAPVALAEDLAVIPVPGHTAGSACLLYRDRFLFTGDHLAWDTDRRHLEAWPDYCWFDWAAQTASMRRLLEQRFEWVLPGHGDPVHLPSATMRASLSDCVRRMEAPARRAG
jgi:glyoxylase-like metal-dependent hydrolase (beta-lactamase superfamily II)/ferredoxin